MKKAAFKSQSKSTVPSKDIPRKKARVFYRNFLDVISDDSGDDDEFFHSEPIDANYQKHHNTQSPMKQPRSPVTMPSPLKSKIAKNNWMQDLEYFERLDIANGKENASFKKFILLVRWCLPTWCVNTVMWKWVEIKLKASYLRSVTMMALSCTSHSDSRTWWENIFQTILHQSTGTSNRIKLFQRVILCQ